MDGSNPKATEILLDRLGRSATMSLSQSQSGLTLIELLIGIAISILIMLAAFTLLLNLTQSSARVVQTQDVSGAVRASVGYATRRLSEAGFGIPTAGNVLTVGAGSGTTVGNAATFRSRTVSDAMAPVLPGEIETCTLSAIPRPNDVPILEEACIGRPARLVMTGTVEFIVRHRVDQNVVIAVRVVLAIRVVREIENGQDLDPDLRTDELKINAVNDRIHQVVVFFY